MSNIINFRGGNKTLSDVDQLIECFTNLAENPADDAHTRLVELALYLGFLRAMSEDDRNAVVEAIIDRDDVQEGLAQVLGYVPPRS